MTLNDYLIQRSPGRRQSTFMDSPRLMTWLRGKATGYDYWAEVPTGIVKPEYVPGKHISVVLYVGIRTFGFLTADARDKFVERFREQGAISVRPAGVEDRRGQSGAGQEEIGLLSDPASGYTRPRRNGFPFT